MPELCVCRKGAQKSFFFWRVRFKSNEMSYVFLLILGEHQKINKVYFNRKIKIKYQIKSFIILVVIRRSM